jgi:hypothetical protein
VPSKSKAQARTMRAAAHDPAFAQKVGIPQSVARDFVRADEMKKKMGPKMSKKMKGMM